LLDCLAAIELVFGQERQIFIAREITKQFEQFISMSVSQAKHYFSDHPDKVRGEFVLVVAGAPPLEQTEQDWDALIKALLAQSLPVKQIAEIVAQYFSAKKNAVYARVLALKPD
jgi:16S rRNA (cytidine1402-2'-O)-methyltransferase